MKSKKRNGTEVATPLGAKRREAPLLTRSSKRNSERLPKRACSKLEDERRG